MLDKFTIVSYSYLMVKTDFVTIRVPKELKIKVIREAETQRRTIASQLLYLIERGLEVIEAKAEQA